MTRPDRSNPLFELREITWAELTVGRERAQAVGEQTTAPEGSLLIHTARAKSLEVAERLWVSRHNAQAPRVGPCHRAAHRS